MIGPHLTPENHAAVLARAKFRTKKELTRLVRDLNPLPEVPDRIEPIGPEHEPMRSVRTASWEQFATALSPQVRELPAGEQPCHWANDGNESMDGHDLKQASAKGTYHAALTPNTDVALPNDEVLPVGPVPLDLPPVTGPQVFQVHFGTVEEHVRLVERAKALLARERPSVTLGELHLEAMKLLVAALEKRKFGVADPRNGTHPSPRHRIRPAAASPPPFSPPARERSRTESPRQRVSASEANESPTPRQRVDAPDAERPPSGAPPRTVDTFPRQCGARCIGEMARVARMSTRAVGAAAKLTISSCIMYCRSRTAAGTWRRI